MLAGTAIAPASAQVLNLGGATVTRTNLTGFTTVTNGTLQLSTTAGGLVYSGALNDSLGPFSLTKLGATNLTLSGSGLNTYSGNTLISFGKVIAGAVNVTSSNSLLNTGAVGVLDIAGFNQTINGIVGTGASGGVRNTGALATLTIATNVNRSFGGTIGGNSGPGDAIRVVKSGTGVQTLTRASNYTGGTQLAAGGLAFGAANALGTGAIDVTGAATLSTTGFNGVLANNVNLGAQLSISGAVFTLGGVVAGSGSLNLTNGNLALANVGNTFSGGVVLDDTALTIANGGSLGTGVLSVSNNTSQLAVTGSNAVIANNFVFNFASVDRGLNIAAPAAGDTLTLTGLLSGTGLLFIKGGTGTVILPNANTLVGSVELFSGMLGIGNSNALGGGVSVINATAPTGIKAYAADLTLANSIRTLSAFTFDTAGYNLTQTGGIANLKNTPGSLVKAGAGTLRLIGAKTYTGTTTVNAGTLQLDGSLVSDVTVATGGTLSGSGLVVAANTVTVQAGGIIAPGAAAGTVGKLTTGNLVLASGSTLNVDLAAPNAPGGGAGSDLIIVTNNLTLGGTVNINPLAGFFEGNYRLINYGNLLANNTLAIGTGLPDFTYTVSTTNGINAGAGGVNLLVAFTGARYWDGNGPYGDGNVNGGNGTWDSGTTNWTNSTGNYVLAWGNTRGVFAGQAGGTVTVVGTQTFTELDFRANNYTLTGGALTSNGGILDVSAGVVATINSTVTGTGGLIKNGAGTLALGSANSYVGGTALNAGTITVGNNAALGADPLAMADGTTLGAAVSGLTLANAITTAGNGTIDSGTGVFTLAGAITGEGGITKIGSGILTVTGASTYTGATNVNTGTLDVQGSLGATAVTVASAATLTGTGSIGGNVTILDGGNLNPGGAGGVGGTLTVGALTLNNASNVNFELGAANTIAGAFNDLVVVNGNLTLDGKLNVAQSTGGNFGVGIYELFQYGGTLTDNGLDINSLANEATGIVQTAVPGQVNLLVTSPGTLVLYWDGADGVGNGVISGGTGTWNATNTNWTGAPPSALDSNWPGGIAVFAGAAGTVTVDGQQAFQALQFTTNGYNVVGGTGGLVTNGAGVLFASSGTGSTISAPISGAGSIVKQGGGTITLSGDNSYTGGTDLQIGTLAVGSNTALGTGVLTIEGGATLAAATTGIVLANAIVTPGAGIVDSGSGLLTLNGAISGAGSINKIGTGNLALNGANSFNGLNVTAGAATLGSNTAAGTGGITLADSTTLAAVVSGLVLANTVTTLGVGTVDSGAGVFTLNGTVSGAGSINKIGTGNLALNGANSFNGLNVTAGTATLGSNTAADTGGITLADGTTLAAGVSGLVLANTVTTLGVGTVDSGAGVLTLNGAIGGAGSINKVGTGNLALNGANSFNGLNVTAGTATLGSNTAAGTGGITLADGTTLAAGVSGLVLANAVTTLGIGNIDSGTGVFTLNGNVGGAGSVNKVGTGNLALNGSNSFNGLNIAAGTVTVGSNTAAGTGTITINTGTTLAAGGNITLANAIAAAGAGTIDTGLNTLVLGGVISGSGGITKQGNGSLFVNAVNTLSGPTTVAAGLLTVNGSLANSATTVQAGATLAGIGTVGALTVQSGGTVAPGNSGIGTLTVNGAINLAAGSVYKVEFNGPAVDTIVASGPATIAGNLIVTNISAPGATFNTTYTLLSSSARTGTFANASLGTYSTAFQPTLVYTPTSVLLQFAPNSLVTLGGGTLTGNPLAVATAFDAAVRNGYNPTPFFVLYTQGANLSNALSQLSGELHSAERRTLMEDTRVIRETAFDRLNAGMSALSGGQAVTSTDGDKSTTFWLRAAGSWGTAKPDAVGSRFETKQRGILTGIDFEQNGLKVGAMFNYLHTDLDFATLGNSKLETTGGTIYAGYRQPGQGFEVGLGGTFAGNSAKGSRAVSIPGLQQSLTSNINGKTYQIFAEVAYDLIPGDTVRAEPFARVAHVQINSNGFTETGGIAALVGSGQNNELTVVDVGGRGAIRTGIAELSASAAWHRSSGDLTGLTYSSITGLNSPAGIRAVAIDRDAVALEAKADFSLTPTIKLGAGYSGVIGSKNSDHGARATLTIGF